MEKLKRYLTRRGISYRPVEEWSLMFGNDPEGIYISSETAPIQYIKRLGLYWEYRGHYNTVYVAPAK